MSDVVDVNKVEIGKEADHHPYKRPRDAATLMLVDRSGPIPKVLVGKRHDKVVFMPGKFVFPGGSVDKTDNKIPVSAPLPPELLANLMKGSPKTPPSRARAGDCRHPRSLRGNRSVSRLQGRWQWQETARPLGSLQQCRPAARSVRPVSDRTRDHASGPHQALRYPLLHRRCLGDRPSR
jgi:hypothetical protein